MRKRKTYSLKGIRGDYSYSVHEIAEKFGIAPETVLRWIKDEGLERIPKVRPYLVHSSSLIAFLGKKKQVGKRPCAPDEMFCCKCQKARRLQKGSIMSTVTPNHMFRLSGKCEKCGCVMNRICADWNENNPLWPANKRKVSSSASEPSKQHNGASDAPRKCQFEEEEQLCLNITL